MTKVKTCELNGPALDWLVDKILHPAKTYDQWKSKNYRRYSVRWDHGGPVIDAEDIQLLKAGPDLHLARIDLDEGDALVSEATGPTKLIAAMRCYVRYCMGDEVDVPQELAPAKKVTA
jgi:hypothetical protein